MHELSCIQQQRLACELAVYAPLGVPAKSGRICIVAPGAHEEVGHDPQLLGHLGDERGVARVRVARANFERGVTDGAEVALVAPVELVAHLAVEPRVRLVDLAARGGRRVKAAEEALSVRKEAWLACRLVELGGGPEAHADVAVPVLVVVRARAEPRQVGHDDIGLRGERVVRKARGGEAPGAQRGVVRCEDARALRAGGGDVASGGGRDGRKVALRTVRVGQVAKALKVRRRELVVDPPVRPLHLEHPRDAPPHLVEEIGHGRLAVGQTEVGARHPALEVLPRVHEHPDRDARVDDVLAVIARVVPSARRIDMLEVAGVRVLVVDGTVVHVAFAVLVHPTLGRGEHQLV
mmetsp:Transcript_7408/g.23386  ORF Transcript_7408/g.23386 Transcript_7408/m.23386 type:complete len:350 (+) Transcript_7408:389-1438(+)